MTRFDYDEQAADIFFADHVAELVEPAAQAVANRARDLAPRRTGGMADSIKAVRTGPSEYKVSWDQDHFYGQFVELGTEAHPPRPFLRPALDSIGGRVATDNE